MIAFYLGILLLCIIGLRICRNGFFNDFLSKEQSNSIKGIFILFVFIRHILQYIHKSGYKFSSIPDVLFLNIDQELEQIIVVMFLFYSGFGVMESIIKKRMEYVNCMPKRRIFSTLMNFDVAVFVFFILNLILDNEMRTTEIGLSLIGWDSIGNSNWYIFDIILCYFITWLSFVVTRKEKQINIKRALHFSLIPFTVSLIVLSLTKPDHWFDTLFAFVAGLFFSAYKEKIIHILKKNYRKSLVSIIILYVLFHLQPDGIFCIWFNLESIAFAFMIVVLNMKIKVNNRILQWLGNHLFPLYIYQRLAMIALYEMDNGRFVRNFPEMYILICFGFTLLIAHLFHFWQISFAGKKT